MCVGRDRVTLDPIDDRGAVWLRGRLELARASQTPTR